MAPIDSDACQGMMAFWADINEDYVLKYQQWHNCEHVPERVSIEGFIEGRRYRSLDNRPHFLMFYDTESPSVLASDAYMAALNKPTTWTKEALTHFRNPTRDIFQRIAVMGQRRKFASPYITSMRFDLPEGEEWRYMGPWLEAVAKEENVERVRLFKADAAIGKMGTSESKVHGGGPGKQTYLVLVEEFLPPKQEGGPISAGDAAIGGASKRSSEDIKSYWLEIAHTKHGV